MDFSAASRTEFKIAGRLVENFFSRPAMKADWLMVWW